MRRTIVRDSFRPSAANDERIGLGCGMPSLNFPEDNEPTWAWLSGAAVCRGDLARRSARFADDPPATIALGNRADLQP
jgi:hypothetical protein